MIKLIWHNLENTEFFTEFHRICSKVPLTLSTPQLMFQMSNALFGVNLRIIGATLHLKWHNLENTEHSAEFFRKSENWFQTVPKGQNIPLYELEDLWKCLGSVLRLLKKFRGMFSERIRIFQIVSYQLNRISKAPQTHTGVYFDHLEHFVISFKTFEKFRGRFRVSQIVSY